jgi:hypothetical protein
MITNAAHLKIWTAGCIVDAGQDGETEILVQYLSGTWTSLLARCELLGSRGPKPLPNHFSQSRGSLRLGERPDACLGDSLRKCRGEII